MDPSTVEELSDEEVAKRWLTAFPGRLKHDDSPEVAEMLTRAITARPDRVAELRKRLGSLSWFMKALNEPIAKRANREDDCKGKFWESRFKCQALLEEEAVLSCMAYVDLNPARAAMCDTLAESDHTSVQRRLQEREGMTGKLRPAGSMLERPLKPVAGLDSDALLGMTEASYIELVQWTGEQPRPDKRGVLRQLAENERAAPAGIWLVSKHPKEHRQRSRGGLRASAQEAAAECRRAWVRQVNGTESVYYRATGSAVALMTKAEALGQAWMKGVASEVARKILRERPT